MWVLRTKCLHKALFIVNANMQTLPWLQAHVCTCSTWWMCVLMLPFTPILSHVLLCYVQKCYATHFIMCVMASLHLHVFVLSMNQPWEWLVNEDQCYSLIHTVSSFLILLNAFCSILILNCCSYSLSKDTFCFLPWAFIDSHLSLVGSWLGLKYLYVNNSTILSGFTQRFHV